MKPAQINFEDLLASAPDGIVIAGTDGTILLVNDQVRRLFGYDSTDLIGKKVEVLIPESLRERHLQHRAGYIRHPDTRPMGIHLSLVGRHRDGHEFPVEISLSPSHVDGTPLITAVIRDVSERRRLEAERERLRTELETERERQRIGMDLHDGVMQAVYAVSLTLELASDELESDPDTAKASLERAIDQLHDVVRDIRSYIFDLRPRDYTGDLSMALTNLAAEFRQNSLIETSVDIADEAGLVTQDVGIALYHITHEALSNIQKHAYASLVAIRLDQEPAGLTLHITDNGRGFDTAAGRGEEHRGLRNMAQRAKTIGGRFEAKSSPGEGAAIIITVPNRPSK